MTDKPTTKVDPVAAAHADIDARLAEQGIFPRGRNTSVDVPMAERTDARIKSTMLNGTNRPETRDAAEAEAKRRANALDISLLQWTEGIGKKSKSKF